MQVLLDEVVRTLAASNQQPVRVPSAAEQQQIEGVEKPYKSTIEQLHQRIEGLEADVARGEKQIELLKKERKLSTIREDISSLFKEVRSCITRAELAHRLERQQRAAPRRPQERDASRAD